MKQSKKGKKTEESEKKEKDKTSGKARERQLRKGIDRCKKEYG